MSFNRTLTSTSGEFWLGDLTTLYSVSDIPRIHFQESIGIDYQVTQEATLINVGTELLLIPGKRAVQLPSEVFGIMPKDTAFKLNPRYGFSIVADTITIQERDHKIYLLRQDIPIDSPLSTAVVLLVLRRVNGVFAVVENHIDNLRRLPEAVNAADSLLGIIEHKGDIYGKSATIPDQKTEFKRAMVNLKVIGKYLKDWEKILAPSSNLTLVPFIEYQLKITASETGIVNRTLIVYTSGKPSDRTHITELFKKRISEEFGDLSFIGEVLPNMNFTNKGETLIIKMTDATRNINYRIYLTGYRTSVYLPVDILGAIELKDTVWEA